ncbi:KpsF/GutQ family sugar-phosphate isomerase [Neosynechococcus sphagnicola]|uniref:KpsF/GutQ family sugar-phosphate isomerase n=1 Tax=Neosynechococcus sphagnicola TaxID=1501145 RepID=UPI001EF9DCBC|nr:KpsF/GutQ family sugar-phosphate isomerase [Neosynechococcus sphagnicola]
MINQSFDSQITDKFILILQLEAQSIERSIKHINAAQVAKAANYLLNCPGKIIVTGVGKSGIVARKIAATFTSTGKTAIYLSPCDALHGDLGIVDCTDVVMMLSHSGETEELLAILPHLHRRGVPLIALTGRLQSTLARSSTVVLNAGVDREACPLNLAPTASTTVAMAIGDALAMVVMEQRGITPEDFAINHPSGFLGKRLTLTVDTLMLPTVQLTPLQPDSNWTAIIAAITQGGAGAACVLQNSKLVGLITDGDLRRSLMHHAPERLNQLTAGDLMTKNPITIPIGTLAQNAIEIMEKNHRKPVSVLPITSSDGSFVGLLRLHDLVRIGLTS